MLNRKKIVTGLALLLVFGMVTVGCKHHGDTPQEKMDRLISYLTDDMDLTAAQSGILNRLKADLEPRFLKAKKDKEAARGVVFAQIQGDVMDPDKVMAVIDTVRGDIDDIIGVVVSGVADFHKTLTPEQKAKLIEQLEDLKKLAGHG